MIPYGHQAIDAKDIAAVDAVLASDWLTTGPNVDAFEQALAEKVRVKKRDELFRRLRAQGIGVNVHYIPVYRHPYYRNLHGDVAPNYPISERLFPEILSLPMFPSLTNDQQQAVIDGCVLSSKK